MFDIALSEIVIVMLVALVVIGPERLPKVARSIGRTWGRVQRYVNRVKSDIENEMAIDEARQMQARIHQEVDAVGKSLREDGKTLEQHILQSQHRKQPTAPDAESSTPIRPPDAAS
ncbi:MAG: twin arginine-targeting protein translocase TatB [Gallionellales bacterium GWA2_60_142]|nr:MAG: twin arginine-targeting protein translocase TatB [Gallionellales bacterium GWA2_60_142]HCI14173.1 twin-arginine translocase subunit TatB [Gallionellaceae bacterium]